jgi:hypothetical protein
VRGMRWVGRHASRLVQAASIVALIACNEPMQELRKVEHRPLRASPPLTATVLTIRTTFQPSNRTTTSTIVIGDDLARATDEVGSWRLFDFRQDRVAFVDDFAKTFRWESLESLRQRRQVKAEEDIDATIPRAEFGPTGATRPLLGMPAEESLAKLGGYERHLWFATDPLIPAQLFSLMHASETASEEAAMAKKVDEALLSTRGFPLIDHSELAYAKTKIVIERAVVSIDRRNVAQSLLQIPAAYREVKSPPPPVTPAAESKAPAADHPASSSPLPDRKTPEGVSQSSAKDRKTP